MLGDLGGSAGFAIAGCDSGSSCHEIGDMTMVVFPEANDATVFKFVEFSTATLKEDMVQFPRIVDAIGPRISLDSLNYGHSIAARNVGAAFLVISLMRTP